MVRSTSEVERVGGSDIDDGGGHGESSFKPRHDGLRQGEKLDDAQSDVVCDLASDFFHCFFREGSLPALAQKNGSQFRPAVPSDHDRLAFVGQLLNRYGPRLRRIQSKQVVGIKVERLHGRIVRPK